MRCLRKFHAVPGVVMDNDVNFWCARWNFRVNSKAAFFILQAGAKNVSDGGKLITIVTSLLAAFTGFYTSYAGSKAPVEHFTRGVAKELQSRKISVNAIAPGPMDTRKRFSPFALCFSCHLIHHRWPVRLTFSDT